MSNRRTSISTTFLGGMLLVAVLAMVVIGYFWIARARSTFERDAAAARKDFLGQQQTLIRNEVEKVIDYIEYQRSRTEERLKENLKERVLEAHSIALHLYETFKDTLSRPEIERLVKEALRPIRFNDGRGYYFAVTMTGVEMLYPIAPHFENQNLFDLRDAKGNYVVRDEIEVLKTHGEGFVRDYWRKPEALDEMIHPKITYVKVFEPFDWYLGTGEYLDDFEKDLKDEVLDRIAHIRFGDEGYVLVNTYGGDAIITDGKRVAEPRNLWELTDPNGVKVIQEERRVVENRQGDFIYYSWRKLTQPEPSNKVSFIKGIPDWEWMIGAGVYLDDVEEQIAAKKRDLEQSVQAELTRSLLIMALLGLFILALAQFFTRRMKRGIDTFASFFNRAATESTTIDASRLDFSEFVELAYAANSMIEDRIKVEEEKRQLQERLSRSRKMEALGLLTGGVAHDLNNILSSFISYPELMLLDLEPDSKLRKPLEIVHESGLRAAAVVADLLDASRGGQGTSEVLNLSECVSKYLDSPEHQRLQKRFPNISFRCDLSPDLLHIRCSRVHIGKTLMNLVANASEAIEATGTVTISTSNRYVEMPIRGYEEIPVGEYVRVRVSDDGPGISTADLSRIFEPFFTKKILGRSGTGLGLSVVWHTVHGHDGFIDVGSSANGTAFDLYFPVCREELTKDAYLPPLEDLRGSGERILVVDDEPLQRQIACAILERLGYRPESAESGKAALSWLANRTADLVILDMILGEGMNGRETYEAILAFRPDQKAIIATGFAETEEVRRTQALGAGPMVRKPYTLRGIGAAVQSELHRVR